MPGSGFSLTKWYLDCVDSEGRTAIVYWSALSWRGLSVTWHSLAIYDDGREPFVRTSLEQVAAPLRGEAGLEWRAPAIDAQLTYRPLAAPFQHDLLPPADRGIAWRCEAAAADAVVECGQHRPVAGRGYAECLTLTLPPWQLPIKELLWGRWMADASPRSVVWIEWRGPSPLSLVWCDGAVSAGGCVTRDGIAAGASRLTFERSTQLYARSVADTLGRLSGLVAPVVPASWLAVEDAKWRSAAALRDEQGGECRGWAIHEKVVFP